MRVREGEAYLCLQVAGGKEAAVGGRREGVCCWGPAGRRLLLGCRGGAVVAAGSSRRSLQSSCAAPAWQELPGFNPCPGQSSCARRD